MKKIVSLMLIAAAIFGWIPSESFADSEVYLEVIAEEAYIKSEPSKKSEILYTVKKGAILTAISSTVSHGNLWFGIEILDKAGEITTGWIYSERVAEHLHDFTDAGDGLRFCRCGAVEYTPPEGTTQMGAPAVLDPSWLGALGVASELAKLGSAVGTVAAGAMPYISVGMLGGILIYLAFTTDYASYEVKGVAASWEALDKEFKPENGYFFRGSTIEKAGFVAIDIANPMSAEEAENYMAICINDFLTKKICNWFVYTLEKKDAETLAYNFAKANLYTVTFVSPCHNANFMNQYMHFHIVSRYTGTFAHQEGSHILFGAPMCNTYKEGVWA